MLLADGNIFTTLFLKHKHCMLSVSADLKKNAFPEHQVGDTVVLTRMHADRYSDYAAVFQKHDIQYCEVTEAR